MFTNELVFVGLFCLLVTLLAIPLSAYMAKVYGGERTFLSGIVSPLERLFYKLSGIDAEREMTWKTYAVALVVFNVFGLALLLLIQMTQGWLPLNPQHLPNVRWDTALNTAISFMTNTNWQSYSGEATMSYFTQMIGLTVQNFVSAAVGMAAAVAMIRGFARKTTDMIGNFWVDMTRSVLYILLPISIVFAMVLASQGVVQTFKPSVAVTTIESTQQTIATGPVASQIAIKQLGSNGGGYFNANSAHPFENPNNLTNLLELIGILVVSVGLLFMFGRMVGNRKQGRALFAAAGILFVLGLGTMLFFELKTNPHLQSLGVASGVNMEGKEMRFGVVKSVLWGESTTVTSNGSVNSMHDSMSPVSGMVEMFNMGIGEVIFGGVGVGLIGMLFYVLLTMFVAGLMIGRIPEFLGKKLGTFEMVMSVLALVGPSVVLLILTAIAIALPIGQAGLNNPSSHGLSEVLYAFSSALGNNGSAFAGLTANTPFYNVMLGIGMLFGRFLTIIPALGIAGALAQKKIVPETSATFPTTNWVFVSVLVAVIVVMGGLTFFPAYTLGPILDHLSLTAGKAF